MTHVAFYHWATVACAPWQEGDKDYVRMSVWEKAHQISWKKRGGGHTAHVPANSWKCDTVAKRMLPAFDQRISTMQSKITWKPPHIWLKEMASHTNTVGNATTHFFTLNFYLLQHLSWLNVPRSLPLIVWRCGGVAEWRCGRYWMSFKSILYGIISHQCKNDGLFLLFTESFIATSLWSLPLCNPDSPRFLPTFHRIVTAEQYFPWLLKDISIRWKTVWISDAVGQKELEALNTDSTVEGGGGPYRLVCIPLVKSFNQFSPGFTWTHCTFLCTGCVLPVLSVTRWHRPFKQHH